MTAKLPQGWNRPGKNDDVARYIPILAVFLALFICILIFGCVAWRRKRRAAARDLEKKPHKQRILDDDSESELEDKQRARAQQRRLWAKTTARWKPNLKITARRRRKRTNTTSSASGTVYPASSRRASFADRAGSSETLHEDIPSSPSTAQVDTDSVHPALSSPDLQLLDGETPPLGDAQTLPDSHSHEEEPALPPDYRDGTSGQGGNPAERFPTASSALLTAHATPTFSSDNHVSTAHIATDDKNLLARMASLVSAPPVDDPPTVDDPSHEARFGPGPSVPVIEELEAAPVAELETMGTSSEKGPAVVWSNNLSPSSSSTLRPLLSATLPVPTYSREPSPQPPLFPPPPSKAQLAAPAFYEYPSTFESDALDDYHPSAPPFGPSAPEDDSDANPDAVPCAPPLIDEEDELHLGLGPSAPPLPPEEGEIPGADSGPATVSVPRRAHPSSRQRERTFLSPPDYLP
ncbi:hypothetical protein PsYK624_037770 [Phanerochaete sordida]|uniref:Uncharacterized protein n=1 Tax=Phanerochaete sordida TaxID=48140 RepID=A0A9P3G541_9APHY|nr:hypothetical protein PsYK624_037770 [Phanerochaete sordida]